MEILKDIILGRFGVSVDFERAGVVYKETIAGKVTGIGHFEPLRHYSEAHLLMEPNPGKGIEAVSGLDVDTLASNWQSQILHVIKTTKLKGVLTGSELTDVKFTLVAGRSHIKHTEGGDFRESTLRAYRQGLMKAKNLLLEPLYYFELIIAGDLTGKVMNRLEIMKAEFDPPEYDGDNAKICGKFSVRNLSDLPEYISSISSGAGELSLEFGGYAPCPDQEEIVKEKGYDPLADRDNSPDSVFTSHGASVIIPWDQVDGMAHVGAM